MRNTDLDLHTWASFTSPKNCFQPLSTGICVSTKSLNQLSPATEFYTLKVQNALQKLLHYRSHDREKPVTYFDIYSVVHVF